MRLTVDPGLPDPPYAQVRERIHDLVTSGELAPGTRLPPVRRLAEEQELAPNTVARAYRELEAAGVIETRGRAGSFVSGDRVEQAARAAAAVYAESVRDLGVGPEQALELVRRALGT